MEESEEGNGEPLEKENAEDHRVGWGIRAWMRDIIEKNTEILQENITRWIGSRRTFTGISGLEVWWWRLLKTRQHWKHSGGRNKKRGGKTGVKRTWQGSERNRRQKENRREKHCDTFSFETQARLCLNYDLIRCKHWSQLKMSSAAGCSDMPHTNYVECFQTSKLCQEKLFVYACSIICFCKIAKRNA